MRKRRGIFVDLGKEWPDNTGTGPVGEKYAGGILYKFLLLAGSVSVGDGHLEVMAQPGLSCFGMEEEI